MSNEVINPYQTFDDRLGLPLEGGTVTFYTNLTTVLATIYSDEALSVPQSNPYTLDAAGRITGDVKFIGTMTLTLHDSSGEFVRTMNYVTSREFNARNVASYTAMDSLPAMLTGQALTLTDIGVFGDWVVDEGAFTTDIATIRAWANAVGTQYLRRLYDGPILSSWFEFAGDATSALNLLRGTAKGFELTEDVTISGDLILDGIGLSSQSSSKFIGAGSVRGVLSNTAVPHEIFGIAYNISLDQNRSALDAGDLFVDPCLGDDANDGTAALPVQTLSALRTRLNALIAVGANTEITVIFRDGRNEILSQVDFNTSQSSADVKFTSNSGENPYFTGALKWFFRSGPTAVNDNTDVYTLFAADLDNKFVPISTTLNDSGSMSRNQAQAITESSNVCTLVVDNGVAGIIGASSNLDRARVHVTQSWTSSIYHGISLASTNMTYTKVAAQSNFYYNGFDDGVGSGYAPYFIEGLSASKTEDTWCNNGTTISLPKEGNIFFSPIQIENPLIFSADRYDVSGIEIKYHQPTKLNIENDYFGTPKPFGVFIHATGNDFEYRKGSIKYCEGGGIFGSGNNCKLNDNKENYWVGHEFFYIGLDTNPESVTGGEILRNKGQYWGVNNAGAKGASTHSDDVEIKDNVFYNGPTQAIATSADQTTSITMQVYRNRMYNLGMPEGKKSERFMVGDAGGFYHNSLGLTCDLILQENVIFNVAGFTGTNGVYVDNGGVDGTYNDNLVFNIGGRAFYNRNVSGLTDGNSYNRNIFFGTVDAADQTSGTFNRNIIVGKGGLGQNVFGPGLTITEPNSGQFVEGDTRYDFAMLRNTASLFDDGVTSIRSATLLPYIQELYIRPVLESTFSPTIVGTSSAGTGTYTLQTGYYAKVGDYIEFNLRITWSAHTGSGNIRVDLNDLPYNAKAATSMVYPVTIWSNVSASTGFVAQASNLVSIDPAVTLAGTGSIAIQGRFPL